MRPGGKLFQSRPTEYIRDEIDLSQSGPKIANEQGKKLKQTFFYVQMVIYGDIRTCCCILFPTVPYAAATNEPNMLHF